jgi:hypothetical protein
VGAQALLHVTAGPLRQQPAEPDNSAEHEVLIISRNERLQARGVGFLRHGLSELDIATRSRQT